MTRKVLFVERDGALLESGSAVDALLLVPNVIAALQRLRSAGYALVAIGMDPNIGPDGPRGSNDRLRALLASQGVDFEAWRVCAHDADAGCDCRLPAIGLVRDYLADPALDRKHSAVVVASTEGMALAANMAFEPFRLDATPAVDGDDQAITWPDVAHAILDAPRKGHVVRRTRETDITAEVDLDRAADPDVGTGIGFFDHMLEQLGKHGGFALSVRCAGDLEVDEHHTVEDVALALGAALGEALGDKRGIERYGFVLPMDEAEAQVALDLSGRAYFVFDGTFPREEVGTLPTELVPHFFRSLSDAMGATLHVSVRGDNTHHMIEACFKGVARTMRQAFARSGDELPSTKGKL